MACQDCKWCEIGAFADVAQSQYVCMQTRCIRPHCTVRCPTCPPWVCRCTSWRMACLQSRMMSAGLSGLTGAWLRYSLNQTSAALPGTAHAPWLQMFLPLLPCYNVDVQPATQAEKASLMCSET